VNEAELRRRLRAEPAPGEEEAGERAWPIVRTAHAERARVPWIERHSRLVIALALLGALAVAAVTPPGRALVDTVRERVGEEPPPENVFDRVPGGGRLLVQSASGPWVVHEDGSKRLLGRYDDAAWSPRGLYVVATEGGKLVALDAKSGDVRWSLSRSQPVADPRWSGGGLDTRIAYRAGSSLHVVAGDSSPDYVLADGVLPVAPAWQGDSHVLAYAGGDGRIHVVDADSRQELWRTRKVEGIRELEFSGHRLVVSTATRVIVFRDGKGSPFLRARPGHSLLDTLGGVIYAEYNPKTDSTALFRSSCSVAGACLLIPDTRLFEGPGRISNLATSPDGKWIVAGWPDADQFLFFRRLPRLGKVVSVSDVTAEFSPGVSGAEPFPRIAGWTGS
jgi:PQQ enzyme repeat